MATENDPPKDEDKKDKDPKAEVKGIFKEALSEWLEEQKSTRTETAKPKSLLEGLLSF